MVIQRHKSVIIKAKRLALWTAMALVSNVLVAIAQDAAANYMLPPNIYDNIAPGLDTPLKDLVKQGLPLSVAREATQPSGGTLVNRVVSPLHNAVIVPGGEVVVTWISEMQGTVPQEVPQVLLDSMPTVDEATGALLSETERRALARQAMERQQRAHALTAMHDYPIRLHSLRLFPPTTMQSTVGGALNDMQPEEGAESSNSSSNHLLFHQTLATSEHSSLESWSAVQVQLQSNEGYPISQGINGAMISTATGGQMTWKVPEDWPLEGEFEVWIHAQGSPTLAAKSPSFWILEDCISRENGTARPVVPPLPPLSEPRILDSGGDGGKNKTEYEKENQEDGCRLWEKHQQQERKKGMGIFLGLMAMVVGSAAVSLCCVVPYYRRRWAVDPLDVGRLEQASAVMAGNQRSYQDGHHQQPSPSEAVGKKCDWPKTVSSGGAATPLPPLFSETPRKWSEKEAMQQLGYVAEK